MKKSEKKMSASTRKSLQFIIESFLEKSATEILQRLTDNPQLINTLWEQLEDILFKDIFWMDENEKSDRDKIDFMKLVMEYHSILKPLWDQFKEALFDYKYRVEPERNKTRLMRERVDNEITAPFSEYKDLILQDTVLDREQFYDLRITMSFDTGNVTFYKRNMDVLRNFLDLLSNVDIAYFARCEHCDKCIILTRSDKKFCPGCAAKKYQKDKWEKDPEGMKQIEKERYQTRRRRSDRK
jgi:hypothetical protein